METWYSIVRKLQDESESKYKTLKFAERVYRELKNGRIREKQKFKNRMGPEFEQWVASLMDEFPETMVKEIISDDEFWEQTLLVTQGI
jgi:hypothetical protein